MAVQDRNRILGFSKAAFETFDRLWRKRNLRYEHDCAATAFERSSDYFLQREKLLRIEHKIRRCDELLVGMWIADNCFFAQLRQTAFDERAQGLVVERCLAQKIGRADGRFQSRECLEKFRLPWRAPPKFFDFFNVDLTRRLHEQLFLPPDFGSSNHLWEQAPHHSFDRAAIIGADPSGELEQFFAQGGRVADDRFDRSETFRFTVIENGHDSRERRLLAKGNAYARADANAFR